MICHDAICVKCPCPYACRIRAAHAALNQQSVHYNPLDIYYNITLGIPTCFDPQGTTIREPNQSNTVTYVCSELLRT